MKRALNFTIGSAMVLVLLITLGAQFISSAPPNQEQSIASAVLQNLGMTIAVTDSADSGPGTLRQALLDAQSGDTVIFDPIVFPPGTPVTISLTSALPVISQGNLAIDASNGGVILDGSNIGLIPETTLLDDVSLTLNGGANLIANGDFTAGFVHWRPWDENVGATRSLNSSDFTSSPNSYAWNTVAHVHSSRTVYDTSDISDPITEWPYSVGSTVWISATGGSTSEWRFWYKGGQVTARLYALFTGGHTEGIGEWWLDWQTDWTEAVVSQVLPVNTIGVALEMQNNHSEAFTNGLNIHSDGNTIRGLQIANFPDVGISLGNGTRNNTLESNLIYSNGSRGIGLWSASFNTILRNTIGTDASGTAALGNRGSGIYVADGSSDNCIGPDNIIAYNGTDGIEVYDPDALRNTITENSVYDNDCMGVELWNGGNSELAAPLIFDFDLTAGTIAGTTCPNCSVEFFSDSDDEGEIYEGQTTANEFGSFAFDKGLSFAGPHLTATATDVDGNTSEFSLPTSGTSRFTDLQEGNNLLKAPLQPKRSREIENNRIGDMYGLGFHVFNETPEGFANRISEKGLKWMRVSFDAFDWTDVASSVAGYSNHSIDPKQDQAITALASNSIKIMYCLVFWDEEIQLEPGYPRFASEDEIQRYLDYVQFLVGNLKDRVEYFEIFNEPNYSTDVSSQQNIEVTDYINLVRRTVPVIRDEYPEARIVVGATGVQDEWRDYLFAILASDVMPSVDAISWHPMYGVSPEHDSEYYYEYPQVVQEIKDTASSHGFAGEYIAEEIQWRIPEDFLPGNPVYTETIAAKYLARGIMMHLGMDTATGMAENLENPPKMEVIQNLSTIMAGAQPVILAVEVQSVATDTVSHSFALPNGDHLLALWRDGIAVEDDPGMPAMLTIHGFSEQNVTGIDVLHGFEQEMITSTEDGNLVIRDLLVKDYPIVFHLTSTKYVFLPITLKDYAR